MEYAAVDVETANADMASICQIGIVVFEDGKEMSNWQSLVNPNDVFDPWNVQIHGIHANTVVDAPTWPGLHEQVVSLLQDRVVVCHMPFDRLAILRVCERYRLADISCTWLDTAKVVRRTWSEFSQRGYSLSNVASFLGIQFVHHDALEDARAAGQILASAIQESDVSLPEWLKRVRIPVIDSSSHVAQPGNIDGPLFGESIVFTGSLALSRKEAAKRAADARCTVTENVTKTTTLLVVGDQDIRKLAGHRRSSKHRKAEQLQAQGQNLRIIAEEDFIGLVSLA